MKRARGAIPSAITSNDVTGPGYWSHETSGVLAPAVMRYLNGIKLSGDDLAALRAYIRQWIMHPVWNENPYGGATSLASLRDQVDSLTSRWQIDLWTERAQDIGIDPW